MRFIPTYLIFPLFLAFISIPVKADFECGNGPCGEVLIVYGEGLYNPNPSISGAALSRLWSDSTPRENQATSSSAGNSNGGDGKGTKDDECSNPVAISTGNKVEYETDLLGKGEFALSLERTFNASLTALKKPMFGEKWVTPYDHHLMFVNSTSSSCNTANYVLPPYSCQSFASPFLVPNQVIVVTSNGLKKRFTNYPSETLFMSTTRQIGCTAWSKMEANGFIPLKEKLPIVLMDTAKS